MRREFTFHYLTKTSAGYLENSVCVASESNPHSLKVFVFISGRCNDQYPDELDVVKWHDATAEPHALNERDFEIPDTWKYDVVPNHMVPHCQQ